MTEDEKIRLLAKIAAHIAGGLAANPSFTRARGDVMFTDAQLDRISATAGRVLETIEADHRNWEDEE